MSYRHDPLALIEYWSIDPDYDGATSVVSGKIIVAIPVMVTMTAKR